MTSSTQMSPWVATYPQATSDDAMQTVLTVYHQTPVFECATKQPKRQKTRAFPGGQVELQGVHIDPAQRFQ